MGIDANPIVDSFGCCARAASGHAAAVPPKRDEVASFQLIELHSVALENPPGVNTGLVIPPL